MANPSPPQQKKFPTDLPRLFDILHSQVEQHRTLPTAAAMPPGCFCKIVCWLFWRVLFVITRCKLWFRAQSALPPCLLLERLHCDAFER